MLGKIFLVLFYLLFPVAVIIGVTKSKLIKKIGSIVICYAAGLLIGNINILPENISGLQDILTMVTVPLAIPLLLFSENVTKWFSMARTTAISLLLGLLSVVIMIIIGNYIFREMIPDSWKISSMLIGVYSGGTPNLAAIAGMLKVDEELYILTHTSDLLVGALLLFFLITAGQRFFELFLNKYRTKGSEKTNADMDRLHDIESYEGMLGSENRIPLLKAFGLSLLISAIGGGLSMLFDPNSQSIVAILTITTLGIGASLIPSVNSLPKTFPLGMYFILVFSVVVASMADLGKMLNQEQSTILISIFCFVVLAVIGSLLLHAIFSWIFKIDADHFIITSVALSMSPPFVPVIAGALKNREVVLPGLLLGILGYAVGNYLGYLMSLILN